MKRNTDISGKSADINLCLFEWLHDLNDSCTTFVFGILYVQGG